MTLYEIFRMVQGAEYTHTNEGISFSVKRYAGDTLIILFEQSNGRHDWRTNFNFFPKKIKDIFRCHRGFYNAFENVKPHLSRLICDPTVKSIMIAGYSHGAALALLTYAYAVTKRPELKHTITGYGFGCPRVIFGNPKGDFYNLFANFTIIRNCRDIVTHLPPLFLGFRHVGILRHIGKNGWYGFIDSHRPEIYEIELKRLQDDFGI